MSYAYLDRPEYRDIHLCRIEENNNGLPFYILRRSDCNLQPHRHAYVQIVYVSKGKLQHVLNKTVFDLYHGDIFIIPPYVPHCFRETGPEPYEIIEFEFVPEFIDERFVRSYKENSFMDFAYLEPFLVAEKEIRPRLNLAGPVQLEVERILATVIREYERREADFALLIKALLQELLVLVSRAFSRSLSGSDGQALFDRHRAALHQAIDYVHQNITGPVSVEEAARVAMLSQSYFRYLFKQLFQKSFVEYVNDLRVARARDLLREKPDRLVIDICHDVGFCSVAHFNRLFRACCGMTPQAYRKTAGRM